MSKQMVGRVRLGGFLGVLAAGFLGVAVMGAGIASGTVSMSFAISGVPYKATADRMIASGVVQFGKLEQGEAGTHPVLVNGFRRAELSNFCQSITPANKMITVRIAAPSMTATDLVIGLDDAVGEMTMTGVQMGVDAAELTKGPVGATGEAGSFGAQADGLEFNQLRQQAWSTTAATMNLKGTRITATPGTDQSCY